MLHKHGSFVCVLACVFAFSACTESKEKTALAAPKVADKSPNSASSQPKAPPTSVLGSNGAISKYRKGDKVVYRYSGTFSSAPVTLTEEIKSVTAGNVLEIFITAQRGNEKRRWIQIVTDTPENQKKNMIDALFVVDENGVKKKLEDIRGNIFKMYEWTLPKGMDKPPENPSRAKEKVDILGTEYLCDVERGENSVAGKSVTFAFRKCQGFLWTNGPSELVTKDGNAIWKVEVLSSTRVPG